jgi:oligopeptide/dipeptide ABC transporter ATP-binding protein
LSEVLLSVRDLHVEFVTTRGVVHAVNGVSLDVGAGETLGIVGESGCGKSVTARAVIGTLPRTARVVRGEVQFDGRDLLRLAERRMRAVRGREIAMVFQDPMTSLNPVLTIGRQIREALEAHTDLSKRAATVRAAELLDRVGIPSPDARLRDYPHQFSGGMRQRAMIAMALACEPKLLIADEPTTALDVTVQAEILKLLQELVAEQRTALILITHDLGVVARMCERVSVMYGGMVVEDTTADELFAGPRHPYTAGLLRSVPRVDAGDAPLEPISGAPSDILTSLSACPFAPRCPRRQTRCDERVPELAPIAPNHDVACFNPVGAFDVYAREVRDG